MPEDITVRRTPPLASLTEEQRSEIGRLAGQQQVDAFDLGKLSAWHRSVRDPNDQAAIEAVLSKYPRGQKPQPQQAPQDVTAQQFIEAAERAFARWEARQ